jgi:hypothetical protein
MFKMVSRVVYRIKRRCSRHPAYNPVKDGNGRFRHQQKSVLKPSDLSRDRQSEIEHQNPRTAPGESMTRIALQSQLVSTKEASEILGRSPATLKRWRYEGDGPKYVEIRRRIRYDVSVLQEYIRTNTRVPSVRAALEEIRGGL